MPLILVIEDQPNLREEIVDQLLFDDYQVIEASNGTEGLQQALTHRPDAIICDISMPEMNGYDLLDTLRTQPETMTIPFIFVTAHADKTSMRHGMELGADDFLVKPFTRSELMYALQARLRHAESIRQRYTEDLESTRSRLVQLLTHELRTPLIGIKLASEVLNRHMERLSHEQLRDLIGSVQSGGERLGHLVEQLLLYFQLDSNYITPQTFLEQCSETSIQVLIMSSVNNARRHGHRNKTIPINTTSEHGEDMIFCHPELLKHALTELITNAVNFSRADGTVEISVQADEQFVRVDIADQGIGIAPEQIPVAFQPFQQLNRGVQEQQGIGVGLALVQHIMQLHNATLHMDSENGRGTWVTLWLPIRAANA
jgi:two-component system, sensor histidine kinase and response regulator